MDPSGADVAAANANAEAPIEEASGEAPESLVDVIQIPEGHYVLSYGPKTIGAIQDAIRTSFKLFWDGSVSMFQDTVLSSKNNKDVLNELLLMRRKTNDDEDPPITLLHG